MYFLVICEGGDVVNHHKSVLTYFEGDGQVLPGAPRELRASDGEFGDKVHVSWAAGEGATSYELYRRRDGSNEDFTKIATTEGTEYDDTTGDTGVRYIYKARSHNNAGLSGFSNSDSGYRGELPQGGDCPSGLAATDGTYADKVRLEWTGSPAAGYKVWRRQDGHGDFAVIAENQNGSYNDTTADLGEVCFSNTDTGFRAQGQDDACPSDFAATDGTYTDKVRMEWNGVAGHLYRVYRRVTESDQQWAQIASTQDLSYNDTSAEANVGYTYKVVLTVEDQEQCTSNEDTGYRASNSGQDDCPSNLGASDGTFTDKVHLEWAGNGDRGYDVYRKVDGQGDGDFAFLAYVTGLSYDDVTAEHGVTYIYKVGLEQPGGFCWSNTDAGSLGEEQPDNCPHDFAASDGTWEHGVHMEWGGNSDVAYDVLRFDPETQDWVVIHTTDSGLSYLDETAEPGVTYTYKVRLHEGDCHSNEDTGFRPEVQP
jgi:fibronectin type 3 domain-containing protein